MESFLLWRWAVDEFGLAIFAGLFAPGKQSGQTVGESQKVSPDTQHSENAVP